MKNLVIYLAGFDVFSDNAVKIGKDNKKICEKYGFTGLYPLDNECDNINEIFLGNLNLIHQSDIVVANLNSFRGLTMDDGTAFEIGYAYAKGKEVYGYMDDTRSMIEKFGPKDKEGYNVEDFNNPINLMIAESTHIVEGNFEDCIKVLRKNKNNNYK